MIKEHKNEIIGVSIMAGAVIGAFFIIKNAGFIDAILENKPNYNQRGAAVMPLDDRSPADQLTYLKLDPMIKIPKVVSTANIKSSDFPQSILALFDTNIENLVTKSAIYNNGKGFLADFTIINEPGDYTRKILTDILNRGQSLSFKARYYKYSEEAILADIEGSGYEVIVEMMLNLDSKISAHVSIINAK